MLRESIGCCEPSPSSLMAPLRQLVRLSAVEYEDAHDLVASAASALEVRQEIVRDLLRSAGERVSRLLSLGNNPITVDANTVNVGGIAGLLRVAPRFELEVVPKFLSKDSSRWREDFFYLSMLSHHGSLL